MTVHSFQSSLAKSHAQEAAPWWDTVYRRAFPGLVSVVSVRQDGWAQRGGIDRVLTLSSGKTLTVDEKVREKSYPDILLEQWSSFERKTPGWMQKDLACDFIAYAFVPDQRCYLFPFPTLRRAWLDNGRDWLTAARDGHDGFRRVEAKNEGYTTVSVAVPIPALLAALHKAQIVDWGDDD